MKKTIQQGKKLALNTTTIRQLQENMTPEQLKEVVGGRSCDQSQSATNAPGC